MRGSLPNTKKITVYVYPTSGHWSIKFDNYQNPDNYLYRTANEAVSAAREIFQLMGQETQIVIFNRDIQNLRMTG